MINGTVVDLSRAQFATTALYHFLFVPLTLGLSFLLAAMETVYVTTGNAIYKDMARFWGKLFMINFALGVATGLTMEFEFGTNWSFYSSFVGDIFGAPLAIEGLMAFFMESTFVGLMVFGWERLSKGRHLAVTWLVAFGSSLSALWILVGNSFMQDPHGAVFDPFTMRLQLISFSKLIFNADAQSKFVHTVVAGYVTGAIFVAGVSAYYLLRKRHVALAKRSFRMAVLFGVLASIGVITLGDALGLVDARVQPTKLAAMEGLWKQQSAPMPFNLIAFPSQSEQKNLFALQVPDLLSLLVTHSLTGTVPGIDVLERRAERKIELGIPAVRALHVLARDPTNAAALAQFDAHRKDLGYGFLLQRYAPTLRHVTPAEVKAAARDTIPEVAAVFWAFRVMVGLGLLMLTYFVLATLYSLRNTVQDKEWLLKASVWMIPAPFLANECGWVLAELGHQPWTVFDVLPTWMSVSTHSVSYMIFSLIGFAVLYMIFIVIELYLMVRAIRLGPTEPGRPSLAGGAVPVGAYGRRWEG